LHREVKSLALAAGGVLLLIAVFFPNAVGFVGHFIRGLLLGLFGFGAFLIPIAMLAIAISSMVSRSIKLPIIQSVFLLWFILSLLHIFINPYDGVELSAFEYMRAIYDSGRIGGGGIFGAILGQLLSAALGRVGAGIILFVATVILLILVTGRSFIALVGRGVGAAKDYYDERAVHRTGDEIEYDALEPPRIRRKPEPRKPDVRKPLEPSDPGRKNELLHISTTEEPNPAPNVRLIHDDFDEKNKVAKTPNPLFAKRSAKDERKEKRERHAEILNFPSGDTSKDDDGDDYPPIRIKSSETLPEIKGSFKDDSKNGHKDDDDYAEDRCQKRSSAAKYDGYDNDGIYDSEDSDDSEAQVIPLPMASGGDVSPVVKGMVDGAVSRSTQALSPMFADDDDELMVYDEYARASGKKIEPFTWNDGGTGIDIDSDDDDFDDEDEKAPNAPELPNYDDYELPPFDLLASNERQGVSAESRTQVLENSRILEETLRSFKVEAKVVEVSVGPSVTRYDLAPAPGVKVASIANLSNDLALSLAAQGIRIEAPIPGKSAVGIEIPNKEPQAVFFREIIEDERFESFPSKLAFAVGKDIAGAPVVTDIARMPHLLIAGATGSGKSVCINTLIASLLYKARPDEVKLLMIDPKVVELSVYNGIPHLLIPVVTDPKKASGALSWAVAEMETRYNKFAETGCRELKGYNKHCAENGEPELPQIVIIIDELADLMMTCKGEVEDSICRLAQKARAAGIHLIVATQRPSVDVITGLIKANIPSRLAFAVSSGTDSRTVLDMYGAEKLLGKGDMLFLPMGQNKPIRVQGGYISDKEVEALVTFLRAQAPAVHTTEMIQQVTMPGKAVIAGELDEYFREAVDFLLSKGKASTSMLQRQLRIGYNRASRLMDDLEARGIVGPEDGVKPRKVTITREEFRELYG